MKLGAHDVVIVPSQHSDARTRLPIPYPDSLVVTGADYPRILTVKLHCTNVVQVSQQSEQTPALTHTAQYKGCCLISVTSLTTAVGKEPWINRVVEAARNYTFAVCSSKL